MQRRDLLLAGAAATAGYGGYRLVQRRRNGSPIRPGDSDIVPTGTSASDADGTAATDGPVSVSDPPRFGGTLNGRPHRLQGRFELVERSNTSWLHAFIEPVDGLAAGVEPQQDRNLQALRDAVRETGVNLVISLRWNFSGYHRNLEPERVPEAGSDRESALFDYVTRQLRAIGEPVPFVVLGNEPIFETLDEDLGGRESPMVRFTRRLASHLRRAYDRGRTRFLVGSFNKLWDAYTMRKYQPFYRALFGLVGDEDGIDGVDLHLHYNELEQVERMLNVARLAVPEGAITATEVSPIWRYYRYVDDILRSFDGGAKFADRWDLDETMMVAEYYELAKRDPRPREEMADFMSTMHWYNEDFLPDLHDRLAAHDVSLGLIGFLIDDWVKNLTFTADWKPFQINHLFQSPFIEGETGAHPHYLDDFRELA